MPVLQGPRGTTLTAAEQQTEQTDPARAGVRRGRRPVLAVLVAAGGVLALDAGTKALVVARLEGREPVTLVPGVFDLDATRNPGAAFSLGTSTTWVFTVLAVGVAVAIVRVAPRLVSSWWGAALGFVLGGALGNLADRLFRAPGFGRGYVIDFLHLHHWPVFNFADSGITVAAVLALALSLRDVPMTSKDAAKREAEKARTGP